VTREVTRTARGDLEPHPLPEEQGIEETLRPQTFEEFVGQNRVRENLQVFVQAAQQRGESLDHVLFHGPPGLGKTALAHIVAHEMGAVFHATSGPAVERVGDMAALLSNLEPGAVFFIDEIHRLNPTVEEFLYPAMEDFHIDLMLDQGPSARSMRFELSRFTLVGATTRAGLLSSPLRARFGYAAHLDYYPAEDLERIVMRSARILDTALEPTAAREIARRSRGTPRIANRLLRRVRDFAEVRSGRGGRIAERDACFGLERLDVDGLGLDKLDRALLGALLEKFDGGPVGLETLSAAIGEDKGTLEDLVEPYLLQEGFLARTPRGRVATRRAREHLDIFPPAPTPSGRQNKLFD
jgi:Holliday junction DNA helicase RuvB